MVRKLRDYILEGSIRDEKGNPRWFVSERFKGIYCMNNLSKMPIMTFRSYHPFLLGFSGASDLSLHLDELEAIEEDHKRKTEEERIHWEGLPFEKQREHIQFAYDMGREIPSEIIKRYKIKTID